MIHHHPSDATRLAYAAGTLPWPHAHVLAVHLAQCDTCRATMRVIEELGGVLVEELDAVPMSEDALARTLARLDAPEPRPLRPAPTTLAGLATGRWRPIGPGVRLMPLAKRDRTGTRLDLIRVSPGVALPQHDHTGDETACILQGGYRDALGEYRAGDIAEGEPGLDHAPVALDGEECICIIATTGRLRARSLIVRLMQPLYGI
jgi:putative transcriptional regulator